MRQSLDLQALSAASLVARAGTAWDTRTMPAWYAPILSPAAYRPSPAIYCRWARHSRMAAACCSVGPGASCAVRTSQCMRRRTILHSRRASSAVCSSRCTPRGALQTRFWLRDRVSPRTSLVRRQLRPLRCTLVPIGRRCPRSSAAVPWLPPS